MEGYKRKGTKNRDNIMEFGKKGLCKGRQEEELADEDEERRLWEEDHDQDDDQ